MERNEAVGGMVLLLFGMVTIIFALRMPIGTFRAAGTGLFPLCLGIFLMGLSGFYLLTLRIGRERQGEKAPAGQAAGTGKQVVFFLGVMALATLFFNVLGYPLTAFLLMATLVRILGVKKRLFGLSLSFASAAVSYLLFVQWLKIPLPKGWIGL